jgi:hypothetical protein
METYDREEVESAFRHYFLTGPVGEDWVAWSKLFTEDATYTDHFYGVFHGPKEIELFLEGTMSFASHVYSPLVWYNIDGSQVVYKVVNRADHPNPAQPPIDFPSLQIIQYAGDGKWASEEDWWITAEMKLFNERYAAACREADVPVPGEGPLPRTRRDWGSWVDWARLPDGAEPSPSWLRRDVTRLTSLREFTFGTRHPVSARRS